ncbi:hypothetical protein Anapl_07199 [Anas platyrhynchos]|uniref:Uncharacterized protein n=1 Tax=Anas platyrhynchos TaxID=8839 RepID=R0JQ89_ANAPL|nr:hypothetical protein Anapl_07199 [Anas platyrhynchos]
MAAVTSETAQMGGEPRFQLSGSLSDLVDSQFSPFRHQHTVAVRDRTLLPGKSQQQRKYRLLVHRQKQQQCSCCCASPACALQGSETERMKRRMQMQSLSHSPCLPSLMTWKTCALPASVSQGTPQKPFGKFLVIHCAKSCGHAVLRKPTRKGTQSIKEKIMLWFQSAPAGFLSGETQTRRCSAGVQLMPSSCGWVQKQTVGEVKQRDGKSVFAPKNKLTLSEGSTTQSTCVVANSRSRAKITTSVCSTINSEKDGTPEYAVHTLNSVTITAASYCSALEQLQT